MNISRNLWIWIFKWAMHACGACTPEIVKYNKGVTYKGIDFITKAGRSAATASLWQLSRVMPSSNINIRVWLSPCTWYFAQVLCVIAWGRAFPSPEVDGLGWRSEGWGGGVAKHPVEFDVWPVYRRDACGPCCQVILPVIPTLLHFFKFWIKCFFLVGGSNKAVLNISVAIGRLLQTYLAVQFVKRFLI